VRRFGIVSPPPCPPDRQAREVPAAPRG